MVLCFKEPSGSKESLSIKAGRCSGESKKGKKGECLHPTEKEAQVWESIGQPGVQRIKGCGKAKNPSRAKVFVSFSMAAVCATEPYETTS